MSTQTLALASHMANTTVITSERERERERRERERYREKDRAETQDVISGTM